MTTLIDYIRALPPELLAARDTQAIADALSIGRVRRVPTEIGNGLVLETIGLTAGNALLDVIASAPDFRHVKPLLDQGRLRIDSALVIDTLDSLVPAVLTLDQAAALKRLGEVADPVAEMDVRRACWSDTGEWLP